MEKSLEIIWNWYEDRTEALVDFKLKIQKEIASKVSRPNFLNYSPDEINEYFSKSIEDLEHLTCFDLISLTEARLRNDFDERGTEETKKIKKKSENYSVKYKKQRVIRLDLMRILLKLGKV